MQGPQKLSPVLVVLAALLLAPPLWAKDGENVTKPGIYTTPPGPAAPPGSGLIRPRASQRRRVRGRPVRTFSEGDKKKMQRLFDEATFPRRGNDKPWHDDRQRASAPTRRARHTGFRPERTRGNAPIETAAAKPPSNLAWLKDLKTGDLPVRWDPRVIRYLEFYRDDRRGRNIMSHWIKRQGRFRRLISRALRQHKLPQDLIYLAMIESSYRPGEISRAGAAGLWQLMPSNAEVYGLRLDHWVDERRDPIKSTEAAMLYWRDLYKRFGNWPLALAAYNAGYGNILRTIAKYNINDFWALLELESGMPWGTSNYVPKALAVSIVGHNRKAFGYDKIAIDPPFEFDVVTVHKSVSLAAIAKAAGVKQEQVARLNPSLLRGRTPPEKNFAVRVPRGRKGRVGRTFSQRGGDWDNTDPYLVSHGERFEDIATTFGISQFELRRLNGLAHASEARGGMTIVVPKVSETKRRKNAKEATDNLYASGVQAGERGEPLIVPVPDKSAVVPGKKRVFYRVVIGDDSLAQVARQLDVSTAALAIHNGINAEAKLHPRMILQAWVAPDFDAKNLKLLDDSRIMLVTSGSSEHLDIAEGRKGRKRVYVVAKKGQTFKSLGKKYGLSRYDLARINRRSYNRPLEEGERVIVYKVVDRKKARETGVLMSERKRRKRRRERARRQRVRKRAAEKKK